MVQFLQVMVAEIIELDQQQIYYIGLLLVFIFAGLLIEKIYKPRSIYVDEFLGHLTNADLVLNPTGDLGHRDDLRFSTNLPLKYPFDYVNIEYKKFDFDGYSVETICIYNESLRVVIRFNSNVEVDSLRFFNDKLVINFMIISQCHELRNMVLKFF